MTITTDALVTIAEAWSLDLTQAKGAGIDSFLEVLTQKVDELWRKDPQKLANTLYRLDVSEEKVAAAIKTPKSGSIARELAQLIIERELQKAITRREYDKGQ